MKSFALMSPFANAQGSLTPPAKVSFSLAVTGVVIILIVLSVLFLAVSSPANSNFALFFAFSLVSMSLVSVWLTRRNLQGLVFQPGAVNRGFSHQPLQFRLVVENPSRLSRPSLTLRLGPHPIQRFELPALSQKTLVVGLNHTGRGHYSLSQLKVTSDYPIGFFRVSLPLSITLRSWVLPVAKAKHIPIELKEALEPPDERDLDQLRDYSPGDALNRIHWKHYARTGRLVVKDYEKSDEEQTATSGGIWLEWSNTAGPIEQRISQLVAMADWAKEQEICFGLRLPSVELPQSLGLGHYQRCLFLLAEYECPREQVYFGLLRGPVLVGEPS